MGLIKEIINEREVVTGIIKKYATFFFTFKMKLCIKI